VPKPTSLDFAGIADGVKRNNMGFGGVKVTVDADVENGFVTLKPTGQRFPLAGPPPPTPARGRLTFEVRNAEDPSRTALEPIR
jgi:hypothetical protein